MTQSAMTRMVSTTLRHTAVTACGAALVVSLTSCKTPTLPGTGPLSQEEADGLSQFLASTAVSSVGTSPQAAARLNAPSVATRPMWSLVNVQISERFDCPGGGTDQVSGSFTGSVDNTASGVVYLQIL